MSPNGRNSAPGVPADEQVGDTRFPQAPSGDSGSGAAARAAESTAWQERYTAASFG